MLKNIDQLCFFAGKKLISGIKCEEAKKWLYVDVLDNDDVDDDDDNKTLRSQNIPARGGFCPSRSFSAAFSFSSLLLRREAAQKMENSEQSVKKSYLDLRSL